MDIDLLVQTCVRRGKNGELSSPTSFLLDICRSKILLECPVDLSSLFLFLPTVLHGKESKSESRDVEKNAIGARQHSSSSFGLGSRKDTFALHGSRYAKGTVVDDQHPESHLPTSKRLKVGIERSSTQASCNESGADKSQKKSPHVLYPLDTEPWYKTPNFHLVDIPLLDAVIISNPLAMMGLPFLVRNPEFTAKIYATDATAKLGQLLMEELVALHSEFVQLYGRRAEPTLPSWLQAVPLVELEEQVPGGYFGEHWHRLYSTADIRACMARVHGLRYGEEADIDGCLKIKPSSSGFGIGSCNWAIRGAHRSLTYISTSSFGSNHAMPLDIPALGACEVLLFSSSVAVDCLQEESAEARREAGAALPGIKTPDSKVVQTTLNETHQVTDGGTSQKQSTQRLSASPASSLSPSPVTSTAGNSGGSTQKPVSSALVPVTSEKSIKSASDEQEVPNQSSSLSVDNRIQAICRAGVEAVGAGGSVLFPVSLYGSFLEILEEMSVQLRSSGIEVPIIFISPVAEKLLAYVNTVPEWVCPARQEKLYAGEALFGFVEAVQEKRVHHYPALHTPDLTRCWQEPCVVFASHWSLRVGSALQLLHRWRNNPLCLLILTEPNVDAKVLLKPFEPYSIQVLHRPVFSNIKYQEVASIIQTLKPRLTLVPESLKELESSESQGSAHLGEVSCYNLWQPYKIPRFQYDLEVEMSADLALQIQLKQIRSGKVAAARLNADLHHKDGRLSLEMPSPSSYCGGSVRSLPRHQIRWGKVDVDSLLKAFKERQMYDVYVTERTIQDNQNLQDKIDSKEVIIEISNPSPAKIEITSTRINVHANEAALRRLVVEVLNSAFNGL